MRWRSFGSIGLAGALAACGGASPPAKSAGSDDKSNDCKVLIQKREAMESEGQKLEAESADEKDPKVLAKQGRAVSDLLQRFGDGLDGETFHDDRVKQLAADYAGFAHGYAKATQTMAGLLEGAADVALRVERAADGFKAAADALAAKCKKKRVAACNTAGQLLTSLPKFDDAGFPAAARDAAAKLSQEPAAGDDELRKQLDALAAGLRDMADGYGALSRLKDIDAQGEGFDKRGDALDDRAQELCGWHKPPSKKKKAE